MSARTTLHILGQTPSSPSVPDGAESAWRWLTTELAGQPVPPVIGMIGLGDGSLLEALDAHAPGAKLLALEPDGAAANGSERRWATLGWTWTPGQSPTPRTLGPLGVASAAASSGGWTARAYPQADVITLESADGCTVSMRCYRPTRLAWADDALVVSAGARYAMLFGGIREAFNVPPETRE